MEKTETKHPAYYAIIPAIVRYDPDLSSSEKLLYGEITALCNATGECFASNAYFSMLYKKDKVTISRWFSKLKDKGYIHVNYKYVPGSQAIESRIVHIKQVSSSMVMPASKNVSRPTSENAKDNTIKKDNAQLLFDQWWNLYNKKVGKKKSIKVWNKLSPDNMQKCLNIVKQFVANTPEVKYRPHPLTYLVGEMWEDDLIDETVSAEWKKQEAKTNFKDMFGI
jgi:hypothetical protein|tara:strand:- start:2543 stop:3211 length:669 start_codon:yes stop_codon:yes gene_type:complete